MDTNSCRAVCEIVDSDFFGRRLFGTGKASRRLDHSKPVLIISDFINNCHTINIFATLFSDIVQRFPFSSTNINRLGTSRL